MKQPTSIASLLAPGWSPTDKGMCAALWVPSATWLGMQAACLANPSPPPPLHLPALTPVCPPLPPSHPPNRSYSPGEQVFLCYGRHTNLQLVQHYGFVLPPGQNPHDTAPLPPHLLPPAVQQQLAACGGGGGGSGGAAARPAAAAAAGEGGAYLHASGAPSWELLRALRLGCASPAERKAGACRALADEPISAASERGGFDALRTACGAALAALPASIDQDEAKLAALRRRAAGQPPDAQSQQQQQQEQAAEHGAEQQQPAQQPSNAAELQRRAQQALQQERWRAEKLALAVEWRLGYKRTLKQGIALCDAVLGILSFGNAPAARAGRAASGDITARLAALQRRPRW